MVPDQSLNYRGLSCTQCRVVPVQEKNGVYWGSSDLLSFLEGCAQTKVSELGLVTAAGASYLEKADACVTGERSEVLVIIKVNLTQAPGVCKLLSTPVKHPWTAQVPAWCGETGGEQ